MANYCCTVRTNYFHVKDEGKFRELMSRVCGCEDRVELWEKIDPDGKSVFGFGVYGGIAGLRNAQDEEDCDIDESSYDEFVDGLQGCVADDDAIIIMEVGNEKMRYVVGSATIITSKEYRYMDISELATSKAAEMLGNIGWQTRCYY